MPVFCAYSHPLLLRRLSAYASVLCAIVCSTLAAVGSMDGSVSLVHAATGYCLARSRSHSKYAGGPCVRPLWTPDFGKKKLYLGTCICFCCLQQRA